MSGADPGGDFPGTSADDLIAARAVMERLVLDVPDYPEPGVVFKDITPLLGDADALRLVVEALAGAGRDSKGNVVVDKVIGLESRGFILGAPAALALGVGFVPVRKAGKLPRATHAVSYQLEYGEATIEIHQDALLPGDRVLIIDDVLATGGTLAASRKLIEACGATAQAVAMLMELSFLPGRSAVGDLPFTVLTTV